MSMLLFLRDGYFYLTGGALCWGVQDRQAGRFEDAADSLKCSFLRLEAAPR